MRNLGYQGFESTMCKVITPQHVPLISPTVEFINYEKAANTVMKVSVIIPTYNRAIMVINALESAIKQSIEELEIIVVDDGSIDHTVQTLAPYRDRILYLRTENQGPAGARNTGMQAATGDYIAYLDSDDLYRPFKLALQCGLLDLHPEVGMVYTEFSGFDDQGYYDEWHLQHYHSSAYKRGRIKYSDLFAASKPLSETTYGQFSLTDSHPDWLSKRVWFGYIYEQYLLNTLVFTNSMVFRRSMLDQVGLQEPRFGLFHDLEFALRLCKAASVAFIDIPTYLLRYHPEQISGTSDSADAQIWIRKQRNLLQVFREHTRSDERQQKLSQNQVNKQTARLCRAIAIPMLAYNQANKHHAHYYSRRARCYLRTCFQNGHPQCLLWMLSFMPHLVRRVGFKLIDLYEKWQQKKANEGS